MQVSGITSEGPLISDAFGNIDSTSSIATQFGGTGTTTAPSSGQILYSQSGTNYAPATFSSLPGLVSSGLTASRPASPTSGQLYLNTSTGQLEVYSNSNWYAVATAPSAPTIGVATNQSSGRAYNNGQASVAFSAPTTLGIPTSYTVTSSPGSFTATGSSSPIVVTGLQSATSYTYRVTATNGYGTSSQSSASSAVTATTVPQAPTIGVATPGNASANVAYTAGATGGSTITSFTATSSPGGLTGTGTSPITVSGLTNGTAYTFTVTATNANGTSAPSSASSSVTPVAILATGGNTIINDGTYWYHVFLSSGTFAPQTSLSCDVLVVAGGGGGGAGGAGAGAGGYLTFTSQFLTAANYAITVGAGGPGQSQQALPFGGTGTNGDDSQFGSLTLVKGGGGGAGGQASANNQGATGGSGGGSVAQGTIFGSTSNFTSGQGFGGGQGIYTGGLASNGGGGGAGAQGESGNSPGTTGRGGVGLFTAISGGATTGLGQLSNGNYYFAGGGGGSIFDNATPDALVGGLGGGGTGGRKDVNDGKGYPGTDNTGGGGGGGSVDGPAGYIGRAGGTGGSGIVIVRYSV